MDWDKEIQDLKTDFVPYMESGVYIHDGMKLLFSKNKEELFPSASIIKLPIYLYYYEQAIQGKLNLMDRVNVSDKGRANGSGVMHILTSIEDWSIEQLLQLMIAVSDNEATNQLISYAGLENLQVWIKEKTWNEGIVLRRYLMDYESGLVNEVTPQGAVSVLKEIMGLGSQHPLWKNQIEKPFILQQFRTGLPGYLDEREIPVLEMLNKTGEDNEIRHDVALFRYNDRVVYIAALNKNVKEEAKAIEWMQELGKLAFKFLTNAH
ncbi:serine hydrolase [Carnobacterium sp.]|uniref:serine hydrolase n=1 Tax=Carnobacterium sp. TaxID=48221 RepID=UPI00388FFBB6